jgi:hypothetical protein
VVRKEDGGVEEIREGISSEYDTEDGNWEDTEAEAHNMNDQKRLVKLNKGP